MKIEFDKKLLKYAIYVTLTAIVIYLSFTIMSNIGIIFTNILTGLGFIINLVKPLLLGIVIAYLLFPLMRGIDNFLRTNTIYKVKKKTNSRTLSIVLSYLLILGIVTMLLWGIYFMIGGQLSNNTTISKIVDEIANYFNTNSFSPTAIKDTLSNLNLPFLDSLETYIVQIVDALQNYIMTNLGNMTSNIMSIGTGIATFFIAFIISIYILKDYEYFMNLWKKIYTLIFGQSKLGGKITEIFTVVNTVFSKFIRGQLLEAFCVGLLSAVALSLVGIDYAFVIGIIAGVCNLIPYVGPIVGTVLAAIMGLLSGVPIKILYAIIAMLVVQQVDNNLLAPKIVGDSVGLHAVFTMMAILIGGSIGGLLGMLLAVPIAASIKVLFNNWYNTNYPNQETDS